MPSTPRPSNVGVLGASELARLNDLKRSAIIALFSDDELMELLVLKGGSAMDLIHKISKRASVDIDISLEGDFPFPIETVRERLATHLGRVFEAKHLRVFDLTMVAAPLEVSADFAGFWGGYKVRFKLIELAKWAEGDDKIEENRRNALMIGSEGKFRIDISRFEYCKSKSRVELDGYRIYVYTPEMILIEKLRALCQQTPQYCANMKSPPSSRARDFYDIYILHSQIGKNICSPATTELVQCIFNAKQVPLNSLGHLEAQREYHRSSFPSLEATVTADVELKPFDFYFDYVLSLTASLESLWNE